MILDQSKVSGPQVYQSRPLDHWSGPLTALISIDNTYFNSAGFATAILRWSNGVVLWM